MTFSLMMNYSLHVGSFIYDSFQVVVERSYQADCSIVCLVGKVNDFLVIHTCVHAISCIISKVHTEDVKILFECFILHYEVFLKLMGLSFYLKIMVLFVSFHEVPYKEGQL